MLNQVHQSCIVGCTPATRSIAEWKGKNYFVGQGGTDCLMTFWTITHGLLYTGIGYCCPNLFWESFSIGVAFEIYEKYRYQCEDALDIFFNTGGFLVGQKLRRGKI